MASHGARMLTMAAVVIGLFAVEFGVGLLPPVPLTTPAFRRLVDTPTFWVTFVGNLGAAIAVAALVTSDGDEGGGDEEFDPDSAPGAVDR